MDKTSDHRTGAEDLRPDCWSVRARVRIITEHQSTSVEPLRLRLFHPGEELEMVQWGRPGDESGTAPWWTSPDVHEAHMVPASKVEVLEVLQPLPAPCPAHLIPDATGAEAFQEAYRNAMAHHVVFVAIESENSGLWTVKADTLPAGNHTVTETVNDAVRAAMTLLVDRREADLDAYKGPVYFMMHALRSEERARELAAALHAALYGDIEPLARAVPPAS
ncbi:hypothetical protein ACWDCC_43230 [Streptomyces sp. NPDC001102]